MSTEKKERGAPTKYKPEHDEQAYKLCLLGATDAQLGDFFNVTETTINNWKNEHPSFFESLKKGKIEADANVASSLYHRALGYSHLETKIATMDGQITDSQEFTRHYPPDPTSAIFWLKNRQPAMWRDKPESEEESSSEIHKVQIEVVGGDKADSDETTS